MVSLAVPNDSATEVFPQEAREVHGRHTQRVLAETSNGTRQQESWVARTQGGEQLIRKSGLQLDENGLSWVDSLQEQNLKQQQRQEQSARRVTNENHREMVGAEPSDPATPKLKPLFGKAPKLKSFSGQVVKDRAEKPKGLIAALLN